MFAIVPKHFVALLLASVVSADYNLTYLDVFWIAAPTITLVSSNSIATTYTYQCDATTTTTTTPTPTSTLYTGSPPQTWVIPSDYTELPANTPTYPAPCIPFTMFHGPETYGYRITDKKKGYITLDGHCSWTGVFTDVPITCDAQVTFKDHSTHVYSSGTPTVFQQDDLRSLTWGDGFGYAVATVVEKTRAAGTPSEGGGGRVALSVGVVVMAGGAFVVGAVTWTL